MNHHRRAAHTTVDIRAALWLLASFCLVGPAITQSGSPGPGSPRIIGSVVDTKGQPLARTTVELFAPTSPWEAAENTWLGHQQQPLAKTRTDSNGEFSVRTPKPGFYRLEFHSEGLASSNWAPRRPVLADLFLLPVELGPARTLSVAVTDNDGVALPKAHIMVYTRARSGGFSRALNRATDMVWNTQKVLADASGRTRLLVSHTMGALRISAPGFVPKTLQIEADSADDSDTIRLLRAAEVKVQIVSASDQPVPQVAILRGKQVVAMTDEKGVATLPVTARGSDQATGPAPLFTAISRDSLVGIDFMASALSFEKLNKFTLLPPFSLTGSIVNEDTGKPIPDTWVWTDPWISKRSDSKGTYRLLQPSYQLTGSPNTLRATAEGYFDGSKQLGDEKPANAPTMVLVPAARLEGTVSDQHGRPVPDTIITTVVRDLAGMTRMSAGGSRASAISSSNGSFVLQPLPTDTVLGLVARHPDFAKTEITLEGLSAGKTKTLAVELVIGARAYGKIIDEADQPVANVTVQLREAARSTDMTAMITRQMGAGTDPLSATTDSNGHFLFDSLAAGSYDLSTEAKGYAPAKVPAIEIPTPEPGAAANQSAQDSSEGSSRPPSFEIGTITLSPGEVIEGVVQSMTGEPLEGARITVSETGGAAFMVAAMVAGDTEPTHVTDSEGRFAADSLAPATRYNIEVEHQGFAGTTVKNVAAPTDKPLEIRLQPASTLRGVVTNELAEPMSNVRIALNQQIGSVEGGMMNYNPRRMLKNGTTDEDGQFEIGGLSQGKWDLVASSSGFVDQQRKSIEMVPGADPPELRITLHRGAKMSGTVVDSDNNPLAGVLITRVVQQKNMFNFSRANIRVARSDGNGHYLLQGLPLGRTSFSAKHEAYQQRVRDAEVLAGDNRLDFVLERGFTVSGRVLDPTGLETAGARVKAALASSGFAVTLGTPANSAVSGEDGSYTIEGLDRGSYKVSASKEGFAEGSAPAVVKLDGRDAGGVDIQLSNGTAITGIVTGLTFDELSQIQVMALQPGGGTSPLMAQVNYEGEYRLENVAAGDWMVMAVVGQGKTARETVTIDPGLQEMVVDFDFEGGLTLTGRVLRNGKPVGGTMVIASGTSSSGNGQAATDPEGGFTIEGLEPGGYRIIVTNLSTAPYQETIDMVADQDLQINIREATVTGRVIDQDTGTPLAGVELQLTRTGEEADLGALSLAGLGSSPLSDADGNFVIEGVVEGSYRLTAALDGYGNGGIDFVADGNPVAGLEVSLARSVALTVYVFSPSGSPARQVNLTVLDGNGIAVLSQVRSLAEGGRLDINDLQDGTWDLLINESSGGATARVAVTVPGDPVQVRLPPSGSLRLLVPELVEAKVSARISLFDQRGRKYRPAGFQGMVAEVGMAVTDGRAMLTGLPVGIWRVEVKTLDGTRQWETVARVVEGIATDYVIQ